VLIDIGVRYLRDRQETERVTSPFQERHGRSATGGAGFRVTVYPFLEPNVPITNFDSCIFCSRERCLAKATTKGYNYVSTCCNVRLQFDYNGPRYDHSTTVVTTVGTVA